MAGRKPDETDIRVAANIKRVRDEKGIKQKTVAEQLEITWQQYCKLENGINRLSVGRFIAIAKILGVKPMSLI